MAKTKNKHKHHQKVPYINMVQQRQIQQRVIESKTFQMESELRAQRVGWMTCVAMRRAFGIGPKRFQEKFVPEMEKVRKYWEHCAEADVEYADIKLSQLAQELIPDEELDVAELATKYVESQLNKKKGEENGKVEEET